MVRAQRWAAGWASWGVVLLAVACGGKNAETEGAGGGDDESGTENGAGRAGGGSKAWGTGGTGQAGTWAGDDETESNGGTGQAVTAGCGWGGTDATAPSWGGQESEGGTGGMLSDPEVTCKDGFKDGYETDIDCGGPDCGPCPVASSCSQHRDCKSLVCRAATCQSPTCEDEVKNGSETGVDCGGSCEPCE